MNAPKGITSHKAPAVHDANCEHPGCGWSQQDSRAAQDAARRHAKKHGHVVTCATIVEYRYVPASRTERADRG